MCVVWTIWIPLHLLISNIFKFLKLITPIKRYFHFNFMHLWVFFLSAVQNILLSTKLRRKNMKKLIETEGRMRYDNWYDDRLEIFLSVHQWCVCLVLEWGQGKNWLINVKYNSDRIVLYIDKTCSAIWTKSFAEENKNKLEVKFYKTQNQTSCFIVWFIGFHKMSFEESLRRVCWVLMQRICQLGH